MLGWVIIFGLCLIMFFGLLIYERKNYLEEWQTAIEVGCFILLFVCIIVMPTSTIIVKQSTNEFIQQAAYLENHIVKSDIENAALTTKKIELNEWLYDAQWSKKQFGIFSFYPDSIQDLEPIQ